MTSSDRTMPEFGHSQRRNAGKMRQLAESAYNEMIQGKVALGSRDLSREYANLRKFAPVVRTNDSPVRLDPHAVAIAGLAAIEALGMEPYTVQVLAATALGDRHLVEMATGEGKTLTCALAAAARAVGGRVHVATANDYLASRDAEAMGPLYRLLGLTVGSVGKRDSDEARRAAYLCDVVYGTVQQFGFDHIIDLTAGSPGALLHPGERHAIIVDEADSLLLDEATTSLILSGPAPANSSIDHDRFARVAANLTVDDVFVDRATGLAALTEQGYDNASAQLGCRSVVDDTTEYATLLTALTARFVYKPGENYLVVDPEAISPSGEPYGHSVVLIDEHTGRITADRRLQFGLHDALEARVRLDGGEAPTSVSSITTASITIPSFIALYPYVSGLSGTLVTDADELASTYGTPVVSVPTHRQNVRIDAELTTFATQASKWSAIISLIRERHAKGQPILVGCANVNETEVCSMLLEEAGIPHSLLNAREHEREAELIAVAGLPGAVTIATTMAGRGVDIALGGLEQGERGSKELAVWQQRRDVVTASGGLLVVATTLFSSRRVDAQLRGRSGRQGEPGETIQFASLEDELARTFGANLVAGAAQSALDRNSNDASTEAVPGVNGLMLRAQRRQETLAAATRRQLLEFDAPYNSQREAFTLFRNHVLNSDWRGIAALMASDAVRAVFDLHDEGSETFNEAIAHLSSSHLEAVGPGLANAEQQVCESLVRKLRRESQPLLASVATEEDAEAAWTSIVRNLSLSIIDKAWCNHLEHIVALRADSTLASYRQQDARDSFALTAAAAWVELRRNVAIDCTRKLWRLGITLNTP